MARRRRYYRQAPAVYAIVNRKGEKLLDADARPRLWTTGHTRMIWPYPEALRALREFFVSEATARENQITLRRVG